MLDRCVGRTYILYTIRPPVVAVSNRNRARYVTGRERRNPPWVSDTLAIRRQFWNRDAAIVYGKSFRFGPVNRGPPVNLKRSTVNTPSNGNVLRRRRRRRTYRGSDKRRVVDVIFSTDYFERNRMATRNRCVDGGISARKSTAEEKRYATRHSHTPRQRRIFRVFCGVPCRGRP